MYPPGPHTDWLYSSVANDADLRDLVALFVAEMPERMDNLLARLRAGDWEELRRAAHQLKGVAASYGFAPITLLAARLEEAIARQEPIEEVRQDAEDLLDLCRRVRGGSP